MSGVSVDNTRVAAVAGASLLAVDNDLSVETNWSRGLQVSQDVESVGDGGSGALCPAGAAVARNVLVLGPRHVVLAVHVSPVNILRQVLSLVQVPSIGSGLNLTTGEVSVLNTAAVFLLGQESIVLITSTDWLRELVDSLIVVFAALLLVLAEAQVVWSNYPDIQSGTAFITQCRSLSTRAAV